MFYLGCPEPSWLRRTDVPLFISRTRLERLVTLPEARGPWALLPHPDDPAHLYRPFEMTRDGQATDTPHIYSGPTAALAPRSTR